MRRRPARTLSALSGRCLDADLFVIRGGCQRRGAARTAGSGRATPPASGADRLARMYVRVLPRRSALRSLAHMWGAVGAGVACRRCVMHAACRSRPAVCCRSRASTSTRTCHHSGTPPRPPQPPTDQCTISTKKTQRREEEDGKRKTGRGRGEEEEGKRKTGGRVGRTQDET